MTGILITLTVICLGIPFYVYFGYPALLWLLTRRKPDITHTRADIEPSATLIISCYNEIGVIQEKLNNALAMDYPADKLTIIVVSDGSDDGTDEAVKTFNHPQVQLIRQEGRLGKTMGLNLALQQVTSDIVIFSDANAMYAPDAVRKLVRNFADPAVGYVVGAALYTDGGKGASAGNEDLYWRYEIAIKNMESQLASVVGGDGAIYAIRAALWEPLQQRDINDFVNPLQIIAKGYRGIFDAEARCFEETAGSYDKEIARKERIVNRSIRGLMRVKEVMNPLHTGFFAVEVISHKLLRWLIPLFLMVGIFGSGLLAMQGYGLFQLVTLGSAVLVGLAFLGAREEDKKTLPFWKSVPYYFVMVNLYAVRGIIKAWKGETQVTWSSARQPAETAAGTTGEDRWWWAVLVFLVLALMIGW